MTCGHRPESHARETDRQDREARRPGAHRRRGRRGVPDRAAGGPARGRRPCARADAALDEREHRRRDARAARRRAGGAVRRAWAACCTSAAAAATPRRFTSARCRSSISRETSFHRDTADRAEIDGMLEYLASRACRATRELSLAAAHRRGAPALRRRRGGGTRPHAGGRERRRPGRDRGRARAARRAVHAPRRAARDRPHALELRARPAPARARCSRSARPAAAPRSIAPSIACAARTATACWCRAARCISRAGSRRTRMASVAHAVAHQVKRRRASGAFARAERGRALRSPTPHNSSF